MADALGTLGELDQKDLQKVKELCPAFQVSEGTSIHISFYFIGPTDSDVHSRKAVLIPVFWSPGMLPSVLHLILVIL